MPNLIEFECNPEQFFSANDYNLSPKLIEHLCIAKKELSKIDVKPNEGILLLEPKKLNCLYYSSHVNIRLDHRTEDNFPINNRSNLLALMHLDYRTHFINREQELYEQIKHLSAEEQEDLRAAYILNLKEKNGMYHLYLMNERVFFCCEDGSPCLMLVIAKRLGPDYKPHHLFFYSSWFSKKGFIEILDKIYDLTERENEVIYYAIMGYTLKQTADEMKIAFNTARNERYTAYTKMKIHDVSSISFII